MSAMTRHEREDLQRLIRKREGVLKSAAKQRSADLIADFENQMGQEHFSEDDPVWAEAEKIAKEAVDRAQRQVKDRCREIGIPDRFAPPLNLVWAHRGWDNAREKRRVELRKMAVTAIEAQERKATVQIELSCLDAQEQLALSGSSEEARNFAAALPKIDDLMPLLSFAEVAGESKPPVAERLLSSNALRQQRFRERQKAIAAAGAPPLRTRNKRVTDPLQVTDVTGGDGEAPP